MAGYKLQSSREAVYRRAMALLIVKIFHIAFAATWFGVALMAPGDVRRTAALGAPHLGLLHARLLRTGAIARATSILTLLTGVALILLSGGFARVEKRFHIALGLALVAAGIGIAIGKLSEKIVAAGENATPATLAPFAKKLSALAGVHQLLWFIILILMVVPRL